MCGRCGQHHDGLPFSYGVDAPAYWNPQELAGDPDSLLTDEQCVVKRQHFFIRPQTHGMAQRRTAALAAHIMKAAYARSSPESGRPLMSKSPRTVRIAGAALIVVVIALGIIMTRGARIANEPTIGHQATMRSPTISRLATFRNEPNLRIRLEAAPAGVSPKVSGERAYAKAVGTGLLHVSDTSKRVTVELALYTQTSMKDSNGALRRHRILAWVVMAYDVACAEGFLPGQAVVAIDATSGEQLGGALACPADPARPPVPPVPPDPPRPTEA